MAPNKKYLSLDEAAEQLGIKPDELVRLREKSEIRGFADGKTWKFKADDVSEFRRRQQLDSDPELSILDSDDDYSNPPPAKRSPFDSGMNSDSDVRLLAADEPKKKILSGSSAEVSTFDIQKSDSDVRLVEPPKPAKRSADSDVKIVKPKSGAKDSDSDVKMVDVPFSDDDSDSDVKMLDSASGLPDSDSDVRIAQSDSDVRLAPLAGSDSDVKIMEKSSKDEDDSDSDVMLLGHGKGKKSTGSPKAPAARKQDEDDDDLFSLAPQEDHFDPLLTEEHDSGISLVGDSGIALADGGDSGISLAGDSGISLAGDSGLRLGGDSGIRLSEDSGLQLMQPADSGISLEGQDSDIRFADSGITLGDDSAIRTKSPSSGNMKGNKRRPKPMDDIDDIESTSPMLLSGSEDDDHGATAPLMEVIDDDSLDLEFSPNDTSEMASIEDSGQDVMIFDSDDETEIPAKGKGGKRVAQESLFAMEDADEEPLEELEISDDDLSEESDFEDLSFDGDNEGLDESFSEGSSQMDISVARKTVVVQETEWGAGVFSLLLASLTLSVFGAMVSADLLRNVWATGNDSAVSQGWAGMLGSLWK